jgi:Zn-dependent peptidase ImmA (M78 family)
MISDKKKEEIDKIIFNALSKSDSFGVYPTPVDNILTYSELRVSSGIDLSKVPSTFFAKQALNLKRGIAKLRGVLDTKINTIYLDLSLNTSKQRFVKLHEVGHKQLYWQARLHDFLEDDETLDPDINDQFEAEANYFASGALFQLELFNDKINEFPLELSSCLHLAKLFGASGHATLRRYVEKSTKRCALLVLNFKDKSTGLRALTLRNYFQSTSFSQDFGKIIWQDEFSNDLPFVKDFLTNRKFTKDKIILEIDNNSIDCNYHYYNNSYNAFVLIFPKGEMIKSKTNFIVSV